MRSYDTGEPQESRLRGKKTLKHSLGMRCQKTGGAKKHVVPKNMRCQKTCRESADAIYKWLIAPSGDLESGNSASVISTISLSTRHTKHLFHELAQLPEISVQRLWRVLRDAPNRSGFGSTNGNLRSTAFSYGVMSVFVQLKPKWPAVRPPWRWRWILVFGRGNLGL